jgi:hypothetical protein
MRGREKSQVAIEMEARRVWQKKKAKEATWKAGGGRRRKGYSRGPSPFRNGPHKWTMAARSANFPHT